MFENTFSIYVGIDVRSLVERAIVKNVMDHKNNTICNAMLSSPRHLREIHSRKTQLQNFMDGDEFQNFKTCILGEIFQVELVEVEEKAEGRESRFSDGNV